MYGYYSQELTELYPVNRFRTLSIYLQSPTCRVSTPTQLIVTQMSNQPITCQQHGKDGLLKFKSRIRMVKTGEVSDYIFCIDVGPSLYDHSVPSFQ